MDALRAASEKELELIDANTSALEEVRTNELETLAKATTEIERKLSRENEILNKELQDARTEVSQLLAQNAANGCRPTNSVTSFVMPNPQLLGQIPVFSGAEPNLYTSILKTVLSLFLTLLGGLRNKP